MRMGTYMSLKTQTRLAPQMILACNLLRASSAEIEERIMQELVSNPALEWEVYPLDLEDIGEYLPAQPDIIEQLLGQLRLSLHEDELEIAEFLLHSLDIHGFLREPAPDLANELSVPVEIIERVVEALHKIDPPGIGARNAQECLLIQLSQLDEQPPECHLARRLIAEGWDEFTHQRWKLAAHKLSVGEDALSKARNFIVQNLRPYPLSLVGERPSEPGFLPAPDVIIIRSVEAGKLRYRLEVPQEEACEIRLCESFAHALSLTDQRESLGEDERSWMRAHAERVRLFAAAMRQRWITLRRVCEAAMRHQQAYLERGPSQLQPLTRIEIARELGLHESTVSRAIQNKIVQLPSGSLVPFSNFFDHSIAMQAAIRHVMMQSEKSLNDQEIAERLRDHGFTLARRTVAKYRKQLHIQASYHHTTAGTPLKSGASPLS